MGNNNQKVMIVDILDENIANGKSWYLGRISLWDYLESVQPENFDFEIQRGVVRNRYLDSILSSIKNKEAIPPITLTTDKVNKTDKTDKQITIDSFNILDGLQRTYRLWLYKKIAEIAKNPKQLSLYEEFNDINDFHYIIKELKTSKYFIPGVIPVSRIKELLDIKNETNVDNISSVYCDFNIYLYIWKGLSEKETVNKMLILNAGQRKVSINHQYELMFLHIIKNKNIPDCVNLIREKDVSYGKVKRGDRKIGEFIFSSVIIGIQSLIKCKAIRLNSDNIEIGTEDDDFVSENQVNMFFDNGFFNIYLESLYNLDLFLSKDNEYKKWFVKDTTISGIMGAVGDFIGPLNDYKQDDYEKNIKNV